MHGDRDQYGNLWIGRQREVAVAASASGGAVGAGEPECDCKLGGIGDGAPHVQDCPLYRPVGLAAEAEDQQRPPQLELPGVAPGARSPIIELGWLGLDSRGGRLLAGDGALTSGAIAFGEVREIIVRPQRPFRGRYLWVHSSIARSFLIHAVRVGNALAGAAPTPIPADIFAVNYDDLATLQIHDVEPGSVIRIDVLKAPGDMPGGDPAHAWRGVPFHLPAAICGMEIGVMIENIERKVFEPIRFLGGFLGETIR